MKLRRALFLALLGLSGTALAADDGRMRASVQLAAPAPGEVPAAELVHALGLDQLLVHFGETVAISPRQHGIADERFLAAWEATASDAFAASRLQARLAAGLTDTLNEADLRGVVRFLSSDFGRRIAALEQASQSIPADQQLGALAKGQTLYWSVSSHRRAQFDELLDLSSAELTFAMIGESLRGMALGMHLSRGGDIETPWEEIEAAVDLQLSDIKDSLVDAARATLALTFRDLSDSELDTYLAFLRTPAARRFYDSATRTVGEIIRDAMFGLGQDVSLRLRRVNI